MIDFDERLKEGLDLILPCYPELFVDSKTETPCITYLLNNDVSRAEGDTLRYSDISYTIKVWSDSLKEAREAMCQIDSLMKSMGFIRDSSNQLWYDGHLQLINRYTGLGKEIIEVI